MNPPTGDRTRSEAKILLVDDHPIVRLGLVHLIEREANLEVCGEAEDAAQAYLAVEKLRPDLVVVDISLPGANGLALIKRLQAQFSKLPVLVLSMHSERLYAERALRAGARGYVRKHEASENLVEAIRKVLGGRIYLSDRTTASMLDQYVVGAGSGEGPSLNRLSDRELEVFELVGQGHSTRLIAEKLSLSVKTIEAHRQHIKQKLDLHSATELLQRATQWVHEVRSD